MSNKINFGFPKGRYIDLPILDTKGKSITDFIEEHLVHDEIITEKNDSTGCNEIVCDADQAEMIDKRLLEIDLKISELSEKIMKLECISQALSENEDE